MKTYVLSLARMKFFGRHGVYAAETASGQAFIVSVELTLPLPPADRRDELAATIDYCRVQEEVRRIVEGTPRKLIETVADELADRLLQQFPTVEEILVEVLKPQPPVTFDFEGVAARVRRRRVDLPSA